MRTLRIHLIRHGATDANIQGVYIGGKTDLPLSPEGLNELRLIRDHLDFPRIERLYASPMLRCRQTAAVLYPDHAVHSVEELREYNFGAFEGKSAAALENDPDFADWAAGKLSAPPEGEENSEFVKRICLGLHKIVLDMIQEGLHESAVIMHGGAIMMLLAAAAVPRRHPAEWTSENGRGYTLLVTPSLYLKSGVVEVIDGI